MFPAALLIALSAALAPQAKTPSATPQPPPPDRPITHVIQNLGDDLLGLVTKDTVIILAAGGFSSVAASNSDHTVDQWTIDHPASSWTDIGRIAGDGWTLGGLAVGTWGVGELTHHRLMAHVGSDLIRAQVMNGLLSRVAKVAFDRPRPKGGGHAFPSGHTSASFATANVLQQHFGWKAGVPAYAFATFVGYTRLRDRAHWLSDVVTGATLGLASAHAVTRGHHSKTWTILPVVTPGGGGFVVRW